MRRIEDRSGSGSDPLRPTLQASEERFRGLIDAGADAVIVLFQDGTIAFANPAASTLLGRPVEKLVGRPFGIPVIPGETTEVDIPRPDGAVRIAEMRTASTVWRGSPAQLAALRDITERKLVEEEREYHLRRERQRTEQLRRLADISARVAAAHDVDSVLRVVTEEVRNLIGAHQAVTRLNSDPDGPAISPTISVSNDFRLGLVPGESWDGPSLSAPLIGRAGRHLGMLQLSAKCLGQFTEDDAAILAQLAQLASVAVENARFYEELRDKDRRKDEFLAMLAHELRNPLAAIANAVRVTTMSGRQDLIDWSMEVIGRQIRHLTRLIDDLLDVSRITRGKIQLRVETTDAVPVLNSAVEAARPLIEQRRHTLNVRLEPLLRLTADPTRLEQIVVNLLTNAAKYTEPGGLINLTAAREGNDIAISVKDNGVGIAPEAISRMFDLFAQGDRSLARSEGGLGIGLTLVRSLAEMHGGAVTATSRGPGTGSEFVVRLPAVQDANRVEPGWKGISRPVETRSARILVVDENVDMAQGMANLLSHSGHDVRVAHNGPSALELASSYRPELVLLDIELPGMDGDQVATALRADPANSETVIVAMSGGGQENFRMSPRPGGFDHHLVKPINYEAILKFLAGRDGPNDHDSNGERSLR